MVLLVIQCDFNTLQVASPTATWWRGWPSGAWSSTMSSESTSIWPSWRWCSPATPRGRTSLLNAISKMNIYRMQIRDTWVKIYISLWTLLKVEVNKNWDLQVLFVFSKKIFRIFLLSIDYVNFFLKRIFSYSILGNQINAFYLSTYSNSEMKNNILKCRTYSQTSLLNFPCRMGNPMQ